MGRVGAASAVVMKLEQLAEHPIQRRTFQGQICRHGMPMAADWPCLFGDRTVLPSRDRLLSLCQCLDHDRAGKSASVQANGQPQSKHCDHGDERPSPRFDGVVARPDLAFPAATKSNQSPLIRVERRTALDGLNTTIKHPLRNWRLLCQ